MTVEEQLASFKGTYKPKVEYTLLVGITESKKFLGAVYKKVEMKSVRYKTTDVAETHVFYTNVKTMEEFIKDLTPYIDQA